MRQTSRGKFNRLQRATAEFTTSALDGYGLRGHWPARPAPYASYPVLVHRLASLLHAAFRPRLAAMPWRFAITSPPSGCEGDLHPKAAKHARHTKKRPPFLTGAKLPWFSRVARAWLAALRRGGRWRASRASGEDGRELTAAPRQLRQERFGVTLLPGPPNCFPSTADARCWFLPAPASES